MVACSAQFTGRSKPSWLSSSLCTWTIFSPSTMRNVRVNVSCMIGRAALNATVEMRGQLAGERHLPGHRVRLAMARQPGGLFFVRYRAEAVDADEMPHRGPGIWACSPASRAIRTGFQNGLSFSGSSASTRLASEPPVVRIVSSILSFDMTTAGRSSKVVLRRNPAFWADAVPAKASNSNCRRTHGFSVSERLLKIIRTCISYKALTIPATIAA